MTTTTSNKVIASISIASIFVVLGLKCWLNLNYENYDGLPKSRAPIPFEITAIPRLNRSLDVAIVIVLNEESHLGNFQTATNSVERYSALHGYQLRMEHDNKYENCSRHANNFFRRHCHTHQLMLNDLTESSWVLFIDVGVAVVNPNKLIEDFIDPNFDIYMYNRFNNWEYSAQYLVKNNERGRNWLKMWAEMEFTLPRSFHGSDTSALHILMMHYLVPETESGESAIGRMCHSMWERSMNEDDLFTMHACTRMAIGERSEFSEQRVKIFPKGRGWSRDITLLYSRWSLDDFMLHSVNDQRLHPEQIAPDYLSYHLIFTREDKFENPIAFPVMNITETEGDQHWTMDGRLLITDSWRAKLFQRISIVKWNAQYRHLGSHITPFMRS